MSDEQSPPSSGTLYEARKSAELTKKIRALRAEGLSREEIARRVPCGRWRVDSVLGKPPRPTLAEQAAALEKEES